MVKKIIFAALSAVMSAEIGFTAFAADSAKGDMLLHYSFSEMNANGVVRDESGNGNDGVVFGNADMEPGRVHFDGEDDYIKMPDGLLKDCDEVTVAINVCPEFDSLHYFTWNFGTSSSEGYMFLNTSRPEQRLRFAITPTSADKEQELRFDDDIKRGTWSNVVVTFKGDKGILYRDGVKAAENTFTFLPKDLGNTTQNWIGRSPYADPLMQGYVEDFRVYDRVLSEDEVKALSDEYMANLGDPVTNAIIDSGIKSTVKSDLALPTEADGASIRWISSDESVITNDGKVTRPDRGEYAAEVTLTAEITKGDTTETQTYTVSVPAQGGGTYGLNITGEKGAEINKDMIGLFFEDINYAADGGLYAEMVENRSFEAETALINEENAEHDYDSGWAWSVYSEGSGHSSVNFLSDEPLNDNNPHYMRFTTSGANNGFANAAYDGLALKKDMVYHGSFYAKSDDYIGGIRVRAVKDGKTYAEAELEKIAGEWTKYSFDMTAAENIRGAQLVILLDSPGTIDFDMISLMPDDAVNGVFRKDLAEMLKAIKPGFLRFPGGCVIEGYDLNNRYNWKDSIGPVEERKENWNRWALHTDGYNHYNQTLGLGFYEFFELCEYLECEAVPVVNVGMACQFQTNEAVPLDSADFKQYIQDALDLIEFANGDATTEYGAIRAEMGHPEPFNLTMLGIGNEQWHTEKNQFRARYEAFEKAIHEKYPEIKLIGTTGPDVNSGGWRSAWSWIREKEAENNNFVYAVDEHYYMTPSWFLQNTDFYDNYDRDTYVFAGEYASRTRNRPNDPEANTLYTALTEAAYFTGLERNSDVVKMSCYAPLFARVGYTQWSPDLIWFDDVSCYGSPSYYVQKLNSNNLGDYNVKTTIEDGSDTNGIFTNTSYDVHSGKLIVKAVNTTDSDISLKLGFDGYTAYDTYAGVEYITGEKGASNSIDTPENITIQKGTIDLGGSTAEYALKPYSFAVITIPVIHEKIELPEGYISLPETRANVFGLWAQTLDSYDYKADYPCSFTDIPADIWYRNRIGFMQQMGYIEGDGDGIFSPDRMVTMEEMKLVQQRID